MNPWLWGSGAAFRTVFSPSPQPCPLGRRRVAGACLQTLLSRHWFLRRYFFSGRLDWLRLRCGRVQAMLQQGGDVMLNLLELIELEIGINDREQVAGACLFINEHASA